MIGSLLIMKKLLLILFLPLSLQAQVNLDSLWGIWNDETQADTNRLEAMTIIARYGYLFSDPDTAFILAQQYYEFAKEKDIKKYMAHALNIQGISFAIRGQGESAIAYWEKSNKLYEKIGDKKGMAGPLGNIGTVYGDQGDMKKALEYYKKALKIYEELGDKRGMANNLGNIGNAYGDQGDYKNALEYYQKSLKNNEEVNNKTGMANNLGNIGNIYYRLQGDNKKALDYFQKALNIHEEIGDKRGIAKQLRNIGSIYLDEKGYDKAIEYFLKAKEVAKKGKFKIELATTLNDLGEAYKQKEDYKEALSYSNHALEIAQEAGFMQDIQSASQTLWEVYKKLGKHKESLEMHELYISSRDSIKNEENQRAAIQLEYQYRYEKQAAEDSVATAKEKEIQQAEHDAEIEKKQLQQYFLYGGIALVLVFSGFMYNRFKVTQKQKEVIEEQKEEVESQRDQIEEQRDDILASINYAKRIQEAILPSLTQIKEVLPHSFVLYKPKDVVAGDFYWQETIGNKVNIAAADCTGHGVPGAMVSVVCSNALTKAILEDGITDVGKILDAARNTVVEKLAKSGDVKDGMDISLACFDFENMKLEWAGANNPLYLLRNGEIQITKGDREPIGLTDNPTPFTKHNFDLQKGDSIYLFTDGYADQFGGSEGKKLGYKNFRDKLIEISNEGMYKQHELLTSYFNEWKGTEEQVDDVCVIGIKIS